MALYPDDWAAETPDKPALVMAGSGRSLTYRELNDRSIQVARHLRDVVGLEVGDAIAVVSDNVPETFEIYWAALRSGLYVTFVNSHLTAPEADYIIGDCGARVLFVSAGLASLGEQLTTDVKERLAFGGPVAGYASYEDARDAQSAEPLPEQVHGEDMLYSSGTTGRSKGIKKPLPDVTWGEPGYMVPTIFGALYGFGSDTVYLSPAPVYHAAPLRFMGAIHIHGGTVVMMEKFDAEATLEAIERFRVTHTQMVPTMFVRLLKLPADVRARYDVSSVRCIVHAAAPCPVDVKRQIIEWFGPVVHEYYASTEANGSTFIDSREWLAHPGSVGRAAGAGILHICDELGNDVEPGVVGTIYFEPASGERAFTYYNDDAKTQSAQHPQHPAWTTVGDLGYVDDEGFLYLTDRASFMIISGGVNIYPQEIEDVFALHPKVADIGVVGIPDDEMGERVVAFVQPAPGVETCPALAEELAAYARDHLAGFKVPREFVFSDDLPRTPTGKMVKGKLKAAYGA